jgi:hypothetical protein
VPFPDCGHELAAPALQETEKVRQGSVRRVEPVAASLRRPFTQSRDVEIFKVFDSHDHPSIKYIAGTEQSSYAILFGKLIISRG